MWIVHRHNENSHTIVLMAVVMTEAFFYFLAGIAD